MGIRIIVEGHKPFSASTHRRIKAMVVNSLERNGTSGTSASGRSLAIAVQWCEENRRPYVIHACPGYGYSLELVK